MLGKQDLHYLRVARMRSILLRQPAAYSQTLLYTVRITQLIAVGLYIQYEQLALGSMSVLLGKAKVQKHTVTLALRYCYGASQVAIRTSQIHRVRTLLQQWDSLAVITLRHVVQLVALAGVAHIEPRVTEQLVPVLPIFSSEFGGLNTEQNLLCMLQVSGRFFVSAALVRTRTQPVVFFTLRKALLGIKTAKMTRSDE